MQNDECRMMNKRQQQRQQPGTGNREQQQPETENREQQQPGTENGKSIHSRLSGLSR